MATISEMSGDEREQRAAELKRKMQEAAKRRQAERAAQEESTAAAPAAKAETEAPVAQTAEVSEAASSAEERQQSAPPAETVTVTEEIPAPAETPAAIAPAPATNGAEPAPVGPHVVTMYDEDEELDPEAVQRREMNRREFVTYAWGAALGLLALQGGVASFLFMYPRFREGEFGGIFRVGDADSIPPPDADPQPWTDGKFWLISTQDNEPKAVYMVCTHLGCLYKWVPENFRFECPCHGSKFTHDGYYIEGPAGRSLDYFEISTSPEGEVIVDTGKKILGGPASESPASIV